MFSMRNYFASGLQVILLSHLLAEVELPKSLSFLYIAGNRCCTQQRGLREHLKKELPNLKEIDGDALTDDEWYGPNVLSYVLAALRF
jgi:hypothetical protein